MDDSYKPRLNLSHNPVVVKEALVYQTTSQAALAANRLLLEILGLNSQQLTEYLEEKILENPFVELTYPQIPTSPSSQSASKAPGSHQLGLQALYRPQQSLASYLFEQIMLYRQTDIRDVMVKLVDYLDQRGYLPYDYQELAKKLQLPTWTVLDAMTLFKQLEPAGIGAYDLQECLMLQTEQDELSPSIAYYLLEAYFVELVNHDYDYIQAQTGFDEEQIQACVNYYHTLAAQPASLFDNQMSERPLADLVLSNQDDQLLMSVNHAIMPKITFNDSYYQEMLNQDDPELKVYCGQHREAYQALAQALTLRQELLAYVTYQIIWEQAIYLQGDCSTKQPLSARKIARQLQIPESLVNLAVQNKALSIEGLVVPLTDFFNATHQVGRSHLSALHIKQLVLKLISDYPEWTDQQIAQELEAKKIIISERMVGNFRQMLDD
ncbi:RNA polymerase subunit sigma-54 [Vaginisenegalia massiliensis]|uniref:RNA polymerase factor sigma-54 n=1 Tax=Vaginisenegalia massiliensis TaxID=2058294 RepID=UPI0013DE2815|nr:RNA polymerase subunit sigma-54 [Vaginisenegalia massiliensis]